MLKYAITALLAVILAVFTVALARDLLRHRDEIRREPGSPWLIGLASPVIFFFATMGVSDFVMNTLFLRRFRLVDDKRLPGTLLSSATLPLGVAAVIYALSAEVNFTLLLLCIVCQGAGNFLGARLVAGFDGRRIKRLVGAAMLVSAVFLLLRLLGVGGDGGGLTSLPPLKMAVLGVCAFLLGVGNMIGMGAKAPYFSLLLSLGLSAGGVLPLVMIACSASGAMGGFQYVRRGLYQRKVALLESTVGFAGVAAGSALALNLPQTALQLIMMAITVYTGVSMLGEKK